MSKYTLLSLVVYLNSVTSIWCDPIYTKNYSSSAAFEAAVQGNQQKVENYSTLPLGTVIDNGQTIDGITYSNFLFQAQQNVTVPPTTSGIIANGFDSSPLNSLAANHSYMGSQRFFLSGDSLIVSFAQPIMGLGVFFNTQLNSGFLGFETNFSLDSSSPGPISPVFTNSATYDQGTEVFAGFVSSQPFYTAYLLEIGDSAFANGGYTIPEIVTLQEVSGLGVPEPSTWLLFAVSLTLVAVAFRLKRPIPA